MKTNLVRMIIGIGTILVSIQSVAQNKDQSKDQSAALRSSSCKRENALATVRQQIDFSKTFDDDVARITVLVRAADLIWAFEEKQARAAYTDAFDLAVRNFKEKGDAPVREGKVFIGTPDQRYKVITAISGHDRAWAKKLTEQLLKQQQEEAENSAKKDASRDAKTAERLLGMASSLLETDRIAAISFARTSLTYPATMYLAQFLYDLAVIDRREADDFYTQALAAYASAPMERLLYLSAYAFGAARDAGDMPGNTFYQVPSGFTPTPSVQRAFVQTLLRRVQDFIGDPSVAAAGTRTPDPNEMWLALTSLQARIQQSLPDLAPAAEAAKANLAAQLSPEAQRRLLSSIPNDSPPSRTFDEQVEAALKNPNVDNRDHQLTSAILYGSKAENLDHVLSVLDKLSDSSLRPQIINWISFDRTQQAIKEQKFDEARKLAARVDELDLRTFLYSRIATESLKLDTDQQRAREMLEEIVDAALKAPKTLVTARALLAAANLYTRIDMDRALAVLAEAVKLINGIEKPDFSRQFVIRRIEGKTFGSFGSATTPGFNPDNVFREIGKIDLDSVLNQAAGFSDKLLRSMTTMAVVEQCLSAEKAAKPAAKP
jgi:uncharacterized protein YidB (DUF937 family)